jgi:hypothetical protein
VGLSRLVWDPEGRTLYARPERVLRQGQLHALVVTSRVRTTRVTPLRPAKGSPAAVDARLVKRLGALGTLAGRHRRVSVFTTRSVTAGLEQMRARIEALPASPVDFTLTPGGARSVFPRAALESMVFTRQIATGGPERFAKPAPLGLDLAPPAEVATIALGSFDSASFLTGSRHIPRAPSSQAPAILGHERVQAVFFLPEGAMPAAGWPVIVFGHGFGNDKNLITPLVAGTFARRGFATVAINVVGHGGGPDSTLAISRAARSR